ncbi:peptidase S1 [Priestia megaterium]|uniref:Peptidase S1 n=1 Tax=Priestia megaterium TaxID=1404 RepID=A0AA86I5Q1_PRIMG|nr:trypsin-like peptidase domain-containing protein [Priestia megaterium]AXI30804.1 peptidase S1 [Priestia megaterium]
MDPRDYEREEERKEEYENRQQRYDQYQPASSSQPPKRRLFPVIASSIAGAVLGGGIVLYGAPQLGLMDSADTQTANQTTQTQTATTSTTPRTVSTTVNQSDLVSVVNKVSAAVVGVNNIQQQTNPFSGDTQTQEAGTGSGVIFKKENGKAYVVTNNHVIDGASEVEVSLSNGQKEKAKIVGADALTDLAVLEMSDKNVEQVAKFGKSSDLVAGETVLAIGNPLGEQFSRTVTQGIVSAAKRSVPITNDWNVDVIQTDAAINPGNSGGALINSSGEVVGINSMKISEDNVEGIGFALPSDEVQPTIEQLMENGRVTRPYMGVKLTDVSEVPETIKQSQLGLTSDTSEGVVVTTVEPFSSASDAGLQSKDVIVAIDGNKVKNSSDLRQYLYTKRKVGDTVKLDVYRNGKKQTLSLKLSEQQSSNEDNNE